MEKILMNGQILHASNGEEYDLIGILIGYNLEIMAEYIIEKIEVSAYNKKRVSISWFLSDTPIENEDVAMTEFLNGMMFGEYNVRYSEITGYLWTDEKLQVGGHDLIEIFGNYIGKFLLLKIIVHDK